MKPADVGPWRWAVTRSELGRSAWAVAMALATRMDADGTIPPAFAVGVRRLAADARMHKDTAGRALAELVAGGWLRETEPARGRRPARYRATLPPRVVSGLRGHNGESLRPDGRDATADVDDALRPGSGALCPDSDPVVSPEAGHHQQYQQETSTNHRARWPDGWDEHHPRAADYLSLLERLRHRLGNDWDIVRAEGGQVQKLRNACGGAADAGVDPYRLADIVTAKPLNGLTSYSAGLARRIHDAIPVASRAA